METDEILAHFGVKGMKWGVRKDSHGNRHGTPRAHPDAVKAKQFHEKIKKGSTDSLSNDELQQLVTRLNLEKQFSTLKPPSTPQKSKKILADILLQVGRQQVSKVLNDQAAKGISRALSNR